MTFYVENETKKTLPFSAEEMLAKVMGAVLNAEGCPYEASVNLLLTDGTGIREYNRNFRGMDAETDVLSFPNLEYTEPGDFSVAEAAPADSFDPDSKELLLGDIILNLERAEVQAEEYGHGILREFAFLLAHSLYHLCGYDHMEEAQARVMEEKQEAVLRGLDITRD